LRTGALPQVGGITGALGGLLLALYAAPWLVDVTRGLEPIPRVLIVVGAIIGAVVAGETLGSALGRMAAARVGRGVLSGADRVVGGVLGAAQAILIIWLAGGLLAAGPFPGFGREASLSFTVRALSDVLPPPTEVVGEIAGVLDYSGLPDVFVGLEPIPLPAVAVPSDSQAASIAKVAAASTAHIFSRACRENISGTGALIAPGYLVTNAHVVAGAGTIRATIGNALVDATPVLYDPDLDLAVLYVPNLPGLPLRFAATDPRAGDRGAALGYAGGGPLVVLPAAVSGAYPATGRDIYNRVKVTRNILELRAAVDPGDSGGPFILEDGTIGGLVFAENRTDAAVGYALTPTSVSVAVAPVVGRTGSVSVGACIH
jgi:S1-C subfamily serine protease